MKHLPLLLTLGFCLVLLFAAPLTGHAQHSTPAVDGVIGVGEYGDHAEGKNAKSSGSQTWYMTWDDTNLYVGLSTASVYEPAIIYIDRDPLLPATSGSNANGNLTGWSHYNTGFSSLPFRADVIVYVVNGYQEYRIADGSGGWSNPITWPGSYWENLGTNTRELSIPWSAITGGSRPTAFNFFAYVTSTGGYVYGQAPTENASGNIGSGATYRQYYRVRDTGNGTSTKPFSLNSSELSVGATGANYTTLKGGFDAINAGTFKANINLYVVNSTTETAAATLCASGASWNGSSCGTGTPSTSYATLLIRPSGGVWKIGTDVPGLNGPMVNLNGADNVTIDGRQAGTETQSLTIENTSVQNGIGNSTLRFANDATNNTVRYVTLLGGTTTSAGGVVMFADTTVSGGVGNDGNVIDYCIIGNASTGLPRYGVYSSGTNGAENSGNTISNSNLYNWYNGSNLSYGVYLYLYNTAWTISGNSFFQTASRATTDDYGGIYTYGGSSYVITNNCIGGSEANCGGKWQMTGSGLFRGMRLSAGTLNATSVQGNTIRNVSVTSSLASLFHAGIGLSGGAFRIGDVTPNTIGSLSDSSSLSFSLSTTSRVSGIVAYSATYGDVQIKNNTIAGISVSGAGSAGLRGINVEDDSAGATYTISGNTVANLSNTANDPTAGIMWVPGGPTSTTVSNNTVRNVSGRTLVYGLYATGGTGGNNTVAQNRVYAIESIEPSAAVAVRGISLVAPANSTNSVARNFVHSLSAATTDVTVNTAIRGIVVDGGTGTNTTVQNNMIRLGIDAAGASITRGYAMTGIRLFGGAGYLYFNTVYIGGANVVASQPTNAVNVYSNALPASSLQNNIWVNVRSNGSGTASNLAMLHEGPAGVSFDYNAYYAPGGLVKQGTSTYTTLSSWQSASGKDVHSLAASDVADINLVKPRESSAAVDLHIQSPTMVEGAGGSIPGVTDDYDGESRTGLTPTDIGADAGAFVVLDKVPPSITFTGAKLPDLIDTTLTGVTITDALTGVETASGLRPRAYYRRSTDGNALNDNTCNSDGWKWVEAQGTGGSPYSFTLDYGLLNGCNGVDGKTVIQFFVVAQDRALPPNVGAAPAAFASTPISVALTAAAFPVSGTLQSTPAPFTWQGDDATDPTNWFVPGNWDANAVPGDNNSAAIPLTTNRAVVNAPANVAFLYVEGSGQVTVSPGATLTVNKKLTQYGPILGGGSLVVQDWDWYKSSLSGPQVTLNGVLTTRGPNSDHRYVVYGAKLVVSATGQVFQSATSGSLSIYGTPSSPARIESYGTWTLLGDVGLDRYAYAIGDTRGTFYNAPGATYRKTGGTGRSQLDATFENDGTVEVHTGQLAPEGRDDPSVSSDGQFLIKSGGTLVVTKGSGTYGYYVGPTGKIQDFPSEHGNVLFEMSSLALPNVVDGEYDISGSSTAKSDATSLHILNNITMLGPVNLPTGNNASLTLNGRSGQVFYQLYNVENHTAGTLAINFDEFNIGSPSQPEPKSTYTQTCSHGLCTLGGTKLVQVYGTTTWTDGNINGADRTTDVLVTIGPLQIYGPSYKYIDSRTIETRGAVTFSEGSIRSWHGKIFVTAGSAWDVQHDGDLIAYMETTPPHSELENQGLFKKSAGLMSDETKVDFILKNKALVDLRTGILNFGQDVGTSNSPGDFGVAEGTKLRLHGNHIIDGRICGNNNGAMDCNDDATNRATGSVEVWDAGTTQLNGTYYITAGTTVKGCCFNETYWNIVPRSLGPLVVRDQADGYFTAGPVTTPYDVTLSEGAILGLNFAHQATTFTVNGIFRQIDTSPGSPSRKGIGTLVLNSAGPHLWADGRWDDGGKTVLSPGAALTIDTSTAGVSFYAHTLENRGAVTWSGPNNFGFESYSIGPSTIDNYGTWDIQTDADMYNGSSTGLNAINNWGTFGKSAGSGQTNVLADLNNKAGGLLDVQSGTLRAQYSSNTGDLVNDRGGIVRIGLDRTLKVDGYVTNNGKIEQTQSEQPGGGFARQFAEIKNDSDSITRYRGVTVVPTSGRMETTTVAVWGNQHCGDSYPALINDRFEDTIKTATSAVLRCYDVTPSTPQTADITFYYLSNTNGGTPPSWQPDERNGNGDPYAFHHNSVTSKWDVQERAAKDNSTATGYRYVKATGVDKYSPFALLDYTPLAVDRAGFQAVAAGDEIVVTWETATELDSQGFDLWRGQTEAGPDIKLNPELILSQAVGSGGGYTYTWVDKTDILPDTVYYYWLDELDVNGTITRYGPVSPYVEQPTSVRLVEFKGRQAASPAPAVLLGMAAAMLGLAAWAGARRAASQSQQR